MVDLPAPIKASFPEWDAIEERILGAILARLGAQPLPLHPSIKEADIRCLATERRDLMNPGPKWGKWIDGFESFEATITPWSPDYAEERFYRRFYELEGGTDE